MNNVLTNLQIFPILKIDITTTHYYNYHLMTVLLKMAGGLLKSQHDKDF